MTFSVDEKPCFIIPFADIASAAAQKNDLTLEFNQDDVKGDKSDALCEMRFYIPNQDKEEEIKKAPAKKKDKEEKKEGDDEEPVDERTAAEILRD